MASGHSPRSFMNFTKAEQLVEHNNKAKIVPYNNSKKFEYFNNKLNKQ